MVFSLAGATIIGSKRFRPKNLDSTLLHRSGSMRRLLLLLALAPLLLVGAGAALWRFLPAPPPAMVEVAIGAMRLHVRPGYLREGPAEPNRIDLAALAPDFTPAGDDPRRLPAPGETDRAGAAQIFITLTPVSDDDGKLAPADRYASWLGDDVEVSAGGLLRRRFEDKSPLAGEDFYYSPPDGRAFSARCRRAKIPDDGLPEVCLTRFETDGLEVALRFDPKWLPQWTGLRDHALALARGAVRP
jgi:hypothetical protein